MRISDWSSDVCSSDLDPRVVPAVDGQEPRDDLSGARLRGLRLAPGRRLHRRGRRGHRSDERRVGTERVSTCRSRWAPKPKKKTTAQQGTINGSLTHKENAFRSTAATAHQYIPR